MFSYLLSLKFEEIWIIPTSIYPVAAHVLKNLQFETHSINSTIYGVTIDKWIPDIKQCAFITFYHTYKIDIVAGPSLMILCIFTYFNTVCYLRIMWKIKNAHLAFWRNRCTFFFSIYFYNFNVHMFDDLSRFQKRLLTYIHWSHRIVGDVWGLEPRSLYLSFVDILWMPVQIGESCYRSKTVRTTLSESCIIHATVSMAFLIHTVPVSYIHLWSVQWTRKFNLVIGSCHYFSYFFGSCLNLA